MTNQNSETPLVSRTSDKELWTLPEFKPPEGSSESAKCKKRASTQTGREEGGTEGSKEQRREAII